MLDYKKFINHNKIETREWWQQSSANEFGRLMKGAGRNKDGTQQVTGSDTFHFIHKKDVPKGKKITPNSAVTYGYRRTKSTEQD